jgi:hypothetical protein
VGGARVLAAREAIEDLIAVALASSRSCRGQVREARG